MKSHPQAAESNTATIFDNDILKSMAIPSPHLTQKTVAHKKPSENTNNPSPLTHSSSMGSNKLELYYPEPFSKESKCKERAHLD